MTPLHSIDSCPICGGGLLGVRVCPGDANANQTPHQSDAAEQAAGQAVDQTSTTPSPTDDRDPHGLIICDECEAIWLEPDSSSMHLYPSAENSQCPICDAALWDHTHWATASEVDQLGWTGAINPELDYVEDPPSDENVV